MEGDKNCKCYKPDPTFIFLSCLFIITLQAFFLLTFLKSVVMLLPGSLYTNSSFCLGQAVPIPIAYSDIHFSPAQYLFILGTQFLITFLFCASVLCHSPHLAKLPWGLPHSNHSSQSLHSKGLSFFTFRNRITYAYLFLNPQHLPWCLIDG